MPTAESRLSPRAAHGLLHVTVVLWGFTAILGKAIHLGAPALVFYRVTIVALLMLPILRRRRIPMALSPARAAKLAGTGTLVALHWVCFYASVKVAGVAQAVLCLSTITFFVSVFEPIFFRRRPRVAEIFIGLGVVLGVGMLLRFEGRIGPTGLALGIASSLFSAAFGTWNGRLIETERAELVTFYELSAAAVVTAAVSIPFGVFVAPGSVGSADWGYLLFLAVACTLFPWLWSLRILKTLSPYTVSVSIALEPVYSMVLAAILWPREERLAPRFYLGALFLFALVAVNALLKRRPV